MNSESVFSLNDRLKIAAERAGGPDILAKKAHIARRTLGNYLSGRNEPKASVLVSVSKAANVDLAWLLTGEGEMGPTSSAQAVETPPTPGTSFAAPVAGVLLGQIWEGVTRVYADLGQRVPTRSQAEVVADIYNRLALIDDEAERRGALRYGLDALRDDLLRAIADPLSTKRQA
jgi:transcriptional regulator with XRE-family HTH domain